MAKQPWTILFLSSDPSNASPTRAADAVNEIDSQIRLARCRDHFRLVSRFAMTRKDLLRIVLEERPAILHFFGHGSTHGLVFKDDDGEAVALAPAALLRLLKALGASAPRVVMLIACYAAEQAAVLKQGVKCVIGVAGEIGNRTGIAFSSGFYAAILDGCSVREAVELASVQAELGDENSANALRLDHRPEIDPAEVRFVDLPPPARTGY